MCEPIDDGIDEPVDPPKLSKKQRLKLELERTAGKLDRLEEQLVKARQQREELVAGLAESGFLYVGQGRTDEDRARAADFALVDLDGILQDGSISRAPSTRAWWPGDLVRIEPPAELGVSVQLEAHGERAGLLWRAMNALRKRGAL